MARPKSTAPTKVRLNITVTEQTKAELSYLAAANHQSISELVAGWAARDARRLSRQTGVPVPDVQQIRLELD